MGRGETNRTDLSLDVADKKERPLKDGIPQVLLLYSHIFAVVQGSYS